MLQKNEGFSDNLIWIGKFKFGKLVKSVNSLYYYENTRSWQSAC